MELTRRRINILLIVIGIVSMMIGLTWWFGPIALAGCGLALTVIGLMLPTESR